MLMWGGLYATRGGGWYNTSVLFRLMVRPKFLAATEKRLTMSCKASSVGEKDAVVSKQQLSDEFLDSFWLCHSAIILRPLLDFLLHASAYTICHSPTPCRAFYLLVWVIKLWEHDDRRFPVKSTNETKNDAHLASRIWHGTRPQTHRWTEYNHNHPAQKDQTCALAKHLEDLYFNFYFWFVIYLSICVGSGGGGGRGG